MENRPSIGDPAVRNYFACLFPKVSHSECGMQRGTGSTVGARGCDDLLGAGSKIRTLTAAWNYLLLFFLLRKDRRFKAVYGVLQGL